MGGGGGNEYTNTVTCIMLMSNYAIDAQLYGIVKRFRGMVVLGNNEELFVVLEEFESVFREISDEWIDAWLVVLSYFRTN